MRFTIKNQEKQEKAIEWSLGKADKDVLLMARLTTDAECLTFTIARLRADSGKMSLIGCVSTDLGLTLDKYGQIILIKEC